MRKHYGKKSEKEREKDKGLYVKRAVKVGDSILIRLSNEAVQLGFVDQSVVLIRSVKDAEVLYFKRYNKCYRYGFDTSGVLNIEVKRKVNLFVKLLKEIKAKERVNKS